MNDRRLVAQARAGDLRAFKTLYAQFRAGGVLPRLRYGEDDEFRLTEDMGHDEPAQPPSRPHKQPARSNLTPAPAQPQTPPPAPRIEGQPAARPDFSDPPTFQPHPEEQFETGPTGEPEVEAPQDETGTRIEPPPDRGLGHEGDALLAAIRETPDDDTPKLILADYLEENGDTGRAGRLRWDVSARQRVGGYQGVGRPEMNRVAGRIQTMPQWAQQYCLAAIARNIMRAFPLSEEYDLIAGEHARQGIAALEEYATGLATPEQLESTQRSLLEMYADAHREAERARNVGDRRTEREETRSFYLLAALANVTRLDRPGGIDQSHAMSCLADYAARTPQPAAGPDSPERLAGIANSRMASIVDAYATNPLPDAAPPTQASRYADDDEPSRPHPRRIREVWQGPSTQWFRMKRGRPVPTFDPTKLFPEPAPVTPAGPFVEESLQGEDGAQLDYVVDQLGHNHGDDGKFSTKSGGRQSPAAAGQPARDAVAEVEKSPQGRRAVRKAWDFARRAAFEAAYRMPQALRAWSFVMDTPDDLKKLGYNPALGTAGHATGDPVMDALGVSTHIAANAVTQIGAAALAWLRDKLGRKQPGKSTEYGPNNEPVTGDGEYEFARFLKGMMDGVSEQFGLPPVEVRLAKMASDLLWMRRHKVERDGTQDGDGRVVEYAEEEVQPEPEAAPEPPPAQEPVGTPPAAQTPTPVTENTPDAQDATGQPLPRRIEGAASRGVAKAAEMALYTPNSTVAELMFGKERPAGVDRGVYTTKTARGREYTFDAHTYALPDGRERVVLSAGDPSELVDAGAVVRKVPGGVVVETIHGGVSGFAGLGGVLGRYLLRKYGKIIPDTSAPLSDAGKRATDRRNKKADYDAGGRVKPTPTKPAALKPINKVVPAKVFALAKNMEKNGWDGQPLLAVEGDAITGSHRLAAAESVQLPAVPVIHLDSARFTRAAAKLGLLKPDGGRPGPDDAKPHDDNDRLRIIQAMGYGPGDTPYDVMAEEVQNNDKHGGDKWKTASWASQYAEEDEYPLNPEEHGHDETAPARTPANPPSTPPAGRTAPTAPQTPPVTPHVQRAIPDVQTERPDFSAPPTFQPYPEEQFETGPTGAPELEPELPQDETGAPIEPPVDRGLGHEGNALVAAMEAAPDDDTPRLVLADYLEENGRPEEAGRIRWMTEARQKAYGPRPRTATRNNVDQVVSFMAHMPEWARRAIGVHAVRDVMSYLTPEQTAIPENQIAAQTLRVAEMYAMGLASDAELEAARVSAWNARGNPWEPDGPVPNLGRAAAEAAWIDTRWGASPEMAVGPALTAIGNNPNAMADVVGLLRGYKRMPPSPASPRTDNARYAEEDIPQDDAGAPLSGSPAPESSPPPLPATPQTKPKASGSAPPAAPPPIHVEGEIPQQPFDIDAHNKAMAEWVPLPESSVRVGGGVPQQPLDIDAHMLEVKANRETATHPGIGPQGWDSTLKKSTQALSQHDFDPQAWNKAGKGLMQEAVKPDFPQMIQNMFDPKFGMQSLAFGLAQHFNISNEPGIVTRLVEAIREEAESNATTPPDPQDEFGRPLTDPKTVPHYSNDENRRLLADSPIAKMQPIQGKGINGTHLAIFEDGKGGIIKPSWEEQGGLRPDVIPDGTYYKREAAASSVAEALGMGDLVPATTVRDMGGKPAAAMAYVSSSLQAESVIANERHDGPKDAARAAILDYLLGSTDRHTGNWMVTKDGKIALIDNGLSLPVSHDKEYAFEGSQGFLKNAVKRNLPVPDLGDLPERWPAVEKALRDAGIEEEAIALAHQRMSIIANATPGTPIRDLPTFWSKKPTTLGQKFG